MNQLPWLFIGTLAAAATFISVTTTDDQIGIISGLLGALTGFTFAYHSLSVTVYSQGTAFVSRYPELAALGLALAAPNLFVALTGPLEIVRDRDQLQNEVQ